MILVISSIQTEEVKIFQYQKNCDEYFNKSKFEKKFVVRTDLPINFVNVIFFFKF